jgi:hypothetical protein
MSMHKNEEDKPSKDQGTSEQSRRDFLKGSGVVAGGLAAAAAPGLVSCGNLVSVILGDLARIWGFVSIP